jgi:hypothetical protein
LSLLQRVDVRFTPGSFSLGHTIQNTVHEVLGQDPASPATPERELGHAVGGFEEEIPSMR